MPIEKQNRVDRIEVLESGLIQVRIKTEIFDNGELLNASFHRHVIAPGGDYNGEDARVQAICAAVHTSEVIETFKAATAAQGV